MLKGSNGTYTVESGKEDSLTGGVLNVMKLAGSDDVAYQKKEVVGLMVASLLTGILITRL